MPKISTQLTRWALEGSCKQLDLECHGFDVRTEAVASVFDMSSKSHWLTKDGQPVALFHHRFGRLQTGFEANQSATRLIARVLTRAEDGQVQSPFFIEGEGRRPIKANNFLRLHFFSDDFQFK